MPDYDPYPAFGADKQQWLVKLLEGLVEHPDDIQSVDRVRGGNDLEIRVRVAPRAQPIFTEAVCLDLQTQLAAVSGVLSPVLYIADAPHQRAREAISAAASGY